MSPKSRAGIRTQRDLKLVPEGQVLQHQLPSRAKARKEATNDQEEQADH